MAANRDDIANWFKRGVDQAATHLIVVTDTYDWDDYPVFVGASEKVTDKIDAYTGKNMQRVTEVYRLSDDMEAQLNEHRAFNL